MKRVISFFLVFFISIALLCTQTVCAEGMKISAEADEKVNIGHSFDIKLYSDNTALAGLYLTVGYDSDYLSFKGANCCIAGEVTVNEKENSVDMIFLSSDGIDSSDFITLSFTAKTGKPSSRQKITISCSEAVDVGLNYLTPLSINDVEIDIIKSGSEATTKNTGNTGNTGNKTSSSSKKSDTDSKQNSSSRSKYGNSSAIKSAKGTETIDDDYNGEADNVSRRALAGEGFITDESLDSGDYLIGGVAATAVIAFVFAMYRLGKANARKDLFVSEDDNSLNI